MLHLRQHGKRIGVERVDGEGRQPGVISLDDGGHRVPGKSARREVEIT